MKKLLLTLLGAFIGLTTFARDFQYTYEGQTLTYTVLDEDAKTVETKEGTMVVPGNNVSGNLILPSIVKDGEMEYTLTTIGDYSFSRNSSTSVTSFTGEIELPSTIKRIGAYAFYKNNELYNVVLNEGLEEIGKSAFEDCESLENPVFPSSLKVIDDRAYCDCDNLTEIILPEGLTTLGSPNGGFVFNTCRNLEKAVLVANIDYIAPYNFEGCMSLNKVYLPLELKTIGEKAFARCLALDEITFPATLQSIGDFAFSSGSSGIGSLTSLIIPDGVKKIGTRAFYQHQIERLYVGKGVEVIKNEAFCRNCLKVVELSEGLKEIQKVAFALNQGTISSINLPSTLTTISESAFGETSISELIIPDGVSDLPARSCGSPSILTIGSGVKNINSYAFAFDNLRVLRVKANTPPSLNQSFDITNEQNDNLTLIVNKGRKDQYTTNGRWRIFDEIIEDGSSDVTIYMTGDYALSEEIRTTTGLMPSSVTSMKVVGPLTALDLRIIKENMPSLQKLDMSGVTNVAAIPDAQFENSLISEIIMPSKLESIGKSAFANCPLLQMNSLPEGLVSIGDYAFQNSPRVNVSKLPNSLKSIGDGAFLSCGILNIIAGESLEELGENVFADCTLLETCDLSSSAITEIPDGAFDGCSSLDEVRIPQSVTAIGAGAFSGTALRDMNFVRNVSSIGNSAFSDCRRLVAANIPERVEAVSDDILSSCPRLIAVSMYPAVKYVGSNLFNGDSRLSNVSCAAQEAPEASGGAFDGIRIRYASLTVPTTSYRSYLNAPQWGKFQSIQNRIAVTISPGVDVSNCSEDEYQNMLKDDALEEAEEAAAKGDQQTPKEFAAQRAARRAAQRSQTSDGLCFARLFDGAQIMTGIDTSKTRIFINPEEDVNLVSVTYNGKEMISQMEGNSLLLPANLQGELVILTDAPANSGVNIEYVSSEDREEIYTLNGVKVFGGLDSLSPGVYIVRQGSKTRKMIVK
ncbi:MAG: leucine-rich repeat domain-containing protein [Muribaculaceae bacterium]|nr:leucine-rich repeat domain-containing protein [Muribaculaceae bacterium]